MSDLERFPHLMERPENAARIARNTFVPVSPHHQWNARATCESIQQTKDVGLLVTSGALRVVVGDEIEGEGEHQQHQLYFPAQFCLVPAGSKFKLIALAPNTSFYEIYLPAVERR